MAERVKGRAARLFSGLDPGSFLRAAQDRLRNLARRAAELIRGRGERLWAVLPASVREKLPWLEGRLGFTLVGLVLLVLILFALIIAAGRPAAKQPAAAVFRSVTIPPEDLFLPEEPDFLPPVILEREQRDAWTVDDAESYWYDPLEPGEAEWRERVEQVIDDLLERVP
ncbi:MAG: hypothetical protein LBU28_03640 [Spirochaetaceae bacterium]|jgi:hypothetical protein|nr:hypothetical protein [Spirochaetaceae bacterium]